MSSKVRRDGDGKEAMKGRRRTMKDPREKAKLFFRRKGEAEHGQSRLDMAVRRAEGKNIT